MSGPSRANSVPVARFFDNYLKLLHKDAIRRWYVKHVEAFIKAQNGRNFKALAGADINSYLDVLGRENRLPGWQFSQRITALRILYCELLVTPVRQEVDWQYWLDSAQPSRLG